MDVIELRIGNFILHNGEINKWTIQWFEDVGQSEINEEEITPIHLTEEWLLKFGLDKYYTSFGKSGFNILLAEQGYFYFIWNHEQVIIKTVHQLQNLYFSLTKEELELKELVK